MALRHCWESRKKEASNDHWDKSAHDDPAVMGLEQWKRPVHSYRFEGQPREGTEMRRVDVGILVEDAADGDCYWKEGLVRGFLAVMNEDTYSSHMWGN